MRFSLPFFLVSMLLLAILVFIAVCVRDQFVRPFLGDVLVVIWLFCFLKAFLKVSNGKLAFGVLVFAYLVEAAQYFNVIAWLGLGHVQWLSIVFGATFDAYDLLAYTLGFALIFLIARACPILFVKFGKAKNGV